MALPVTITGLLVATTNVESFSKPFISSAGNVYVFGKGTTTNLIRAFKATDPTSSFSNVGSDVTVTSTNAIIGLDAVQQGDLIHVVTTDGAAAATIDLRYHVFDMSSDSWTTSNETIVNDYSVVTLATAAHAKVNIRSDGDVIVLYNGPLVNISAADRETVYYARRESGSWTVNVEVSNAGANAWFAGGVVIGANDRMHFFFINDTTSDAYQRTLTSANALETFPASYDTSINTTQISAMACGTSYDSSGTIKVRYPQEDNTGVILLSAKLDSADAPTVSTDADITGATDIESGSHRGSFAANGTTLWNAFVGSADSDIYTQSNVNDGGWSTPASFVTAVSNGIRTNIFVRNGNYVLAMVYNDNSNTSYNEKDLGAAGSPFDMDAVASMTWGGAGVATANLTSTALASVTWTGNTISASSAAEFYTVQRAVLSWEGASIVFARAAFDDITRAVLTWDGAEIIPSAWNSIASSAASGGAAGASIDAQDWRIVARFGFPPSTNRWDGASINTANYGDAAISSVTWDGVEAAEPIIVTAGFEIVTSASLKMVAPARGLNLDGWKPKRQQEDTEEEDLIFLMVAIHTYMEQNNVYH